MGLPNIGPVELLLILGILLLVVGPGKLPEVGSAMGKTIREFRKASSDLQDAASLTPKPSAPPKDATVDAPRGTPSDPADDQS